MDQADRDLTHAISLIATAESRQLRDVILTVSGLHMFPEGSGLLEPNFGRACLEDVRAATVDLCTRLPGAARLAVSMLMPQPALEPVAVPGLEFLMERKRKRDVEAYDCDGGNDGGDICGECGEVASVEDDGCCKWRMMRYYK